MLWGNDGFITQNLKKRKFLNIHNTKLKKIKVCVIVSPLVGPFRVPLLTHLALELSSQRAFKYDIVEYSQIFCFMVVYFYTVVYLGVHKIY